MKERTVSASQKILTAVGIVLCVILVPILIVNCTLIVKSFLNKDEVPDFGGYLPLIVLTDSMYPDIKSGDLIFCKTVEAEDVEVDDVISFFDPEGNGTAVVTHKVVKVIDENGKLSFRTKGINNNTEDRLAVPAENLVGEYTSIRIGGAGNVALFMQTTAGLVICVLVPIVLFVGYDLIRRKKYEKTKNDDVAALMAELEALKAANAQKDGEEAEVEEAKVEKTEAEAPKAEEPAVQEPEVQEVEATVADAAAPDEGGDTKNENSSGT